MAQTKAYAMYFPAGNQFKTAAHELASMTSMKSLQKGLRTPTVRYIMDTGSFGTFKRESCEVNEQATIEFVTHTVGKPANSHWTGTVNAKSVIAALTRRDNGGYRVRSTTGSICMFFGPPANKVGTFDFGLSKIARSLIPTANSERLIFGVADTVLKLGRTVAANLPKLVFYIEAYQGAGADLTISCPPEGVTFEEIAGHLTKTGKFPAESYDRIDYED